MAKKIANGHFEVAKHETVTQESVAEAVSKIFGYSVTIGGAKHGNTEEWRVTTRVGKVRVCIFQHKSGIRFDNIDPRKLENAGLVIKITNSW